MLPIFRATFKHIFFDVKVYERQLFNMEGLQKFITASVFSDI